MTPLQRVQRLVRRQWKKPDPFALGFDIRVRKHPKVVGLILIDGYTDHFLSVLQPRSRKT